ncbi:MAG: hypothetical protein J5780_05215, partial [Treponema sp.]|nr:hypothetical protein [Treponema sp.]
EKSYVAELIRKNGTIEEEEWLDNCVVLKARVPGSIDSEGRATTRTLSIAKEFITAGEKS